MRRRWLRLRLRWWQRAARRRLAAADRAAADRTVPRCEIDEAYYWAARAAVRCNELRRAVR